jgi:hypothetical protein
MLTKRVCLYGLEILAPHQTQVCRVSKKNSASMKQSYRVDMIIKQGDILVYFRYGRQEITVLVRYFQQFSFIAVARLGGA